MLWNYQRVQCTILERVSFLGVRYWKVHMEVLLPYGLRTVEEHWVIVQSLPDGRALIVNEMAKYFGLPAFEIVTTVHVRRRYALIKSSDPDKYPEMTLRNYLQIEGNRTDMLVERVQTMLAFRRLMCVCGTTETCILVRKCGKTGRSMLYSLVHKFDDNATCELSVDVIQRWFVHKETEVHIPLAHVMSKLTGVAYPTSIEDDELERYTGGINLIIEHLEIIANRIDPSTIQCVSDVYHYLMSAQQSPMGKKRGRI